MLHSQIVTEHKRLEQQIHLLEQKLSELPEGNLHYAHDKDKIKWFQSFQNGRRYIPKRNLQLAQELARKKYLSLLLKDCLQEKKALGQYLKHHDPDAGADLQNFISHPVYQTLLSSTCQPVHNELKDWMHAPYEKNTNYPEQLLHHTISGNIVRSKSEVMIDMYLNTNNIPFRYECSLLLGDITLYPDFTIRHPETGRFYYWEHFGMMDIPAYCRQAISKIQLYAEHQIIPGHQLITTFESRQQPLSPKLVDHTIRQFFL